MKLLRKMISLASVLGLLASLTAPVFAAEVLADDEYAYMDAETASPELREKILDARRKIVYGDQSWSADGSGYIVNADGTITNLPLFSDLFPDWNLEELSVVEAEKIDGTTTDDTVLRVLSMITSLPLFSDLLRDWSLEELPVIEAEKIGGATTGDTAPYFLSTITIQTAPQPNALTPFYRFNFNGGPVYAGALTLPAGCEHFHIGLTDMDTGEEVNWYGNLELGQFVGWNTEEGVRYGVRISAAESNISGFSTVCVSTDKDDLNGTYIGP